MNIIFDKKINGVRYIAYKIKLENDERVAIGSAIPVQAPIVNSIEYSEETQTFQMTDFINVGERKVKIMFNLDLNMKIVGFIYNDLDGTYDMIDYSEFFSEEVSPQYSTVEVYNNYCSCLQARLNEYLIKQEHKYFEDNQKMLGLRNKNNQE